MKLLRFSICAFGSKLKSQLILLFSLFLLLFMDPTALFGTIYGFYYTISTDFYLYLLYFQQKVFNFSKISRFQMNPQCASGLRLKSQLILLFNLFLLLVMTHCTFWYYSWILFQLTFTFIYNTFGKKFSILAK